MIGIVNPEKTETGNILHLPVSPEGRLLFITFQVLQVKLIDDQKEIADSLNISYTAYFKAYRELHALGLVVLKEYKGTVFLVIGSDATNAEDTWEKHQDVLHNNKFK